MFTHHANFCDNLVNQLMLVDLNADTVVTLALHLKQEQLDAMINGDDYITILPEFALYCAHISHGHELSCITTKVLGVKTALRDAKLLIKFLHEWHQLLMINAMEFSSPKEWPTS